MNNFLDYIICEFSKNYGKEKIPEYDKNNIPVIIDNYLYPGQIETLRWAMFGILKNIDNKSNGFNLDVIRAISQSEKELENCKNKMKYLNIYQKATT